jgi:polyisoprenoid-binding protein YceI
MSNFRIINTILFFGFMMGTFQLLGQTNAKLQPNPTFKISGTSSLHDWDMVGNTGSGDAKFVLDLNVLNVIQSLEVNMLAETIKSGKSGMDRNAYKALKTDKNKNIKFVLKSAKSDSTNQWTFTGDFTIAGVTKTVSFKVKSQVVAGVVSLEGSYAFKLTDFNITPPTALMGTVKTGDDVTITFKTQFK